MRYDRVKKTKIMAEIFKRKSGAMKAKRIKSRTKQKQEWKKEYGY